MTKKCIGIISYMPDDKKIRKIRFNRVKDLVDKCMKNFNLPIIIVAQNWNDQQLKSLDKYKIPIIILKSKKLGITKAREVLRQGFLKLDYDYIICFDDDFELSVDPSAGEKYLKFVDANPNFIIDQDNYLMNFLGIPRWIYQQEAYDLSINPEDLSGYEDWIYVMNLRYKYRENYVNIKSMPLIKKSREELCRDEYTTWKTMKVDEVDITRRCWDIIENNKKTADVWRRQQLYPTISKCIGIISYMPDNPELRAERKRRCLDLFKKIDGYFRLPVLLVAQNWTDEEIAELSQFKNQQIFIERRDKLGITGARIELRRMYLEDYDYDYIILLDDDSDLIIDDGGVEHYLQEIDEHPNMYGVWRRGFPRLMAVSKNSYSKLSFDFISHLEAERGEVWEDDAYYKVFQILYPDEMYQFSKYNLQEVSPFSEFDAFSTWQPTKEQQNKICSGWKKLVADWVEYERRKNN